MWEKAVEWGTKVRTGDINRQYAWRAMNMNVVKTLEYPLVVLTLTEEECNYIMTPILEGELPRSGICRNIPWVVLYGDKDHQGLETQNLHTIMRLR